jgi:hypothetical protein
LFVDSFVDGGLGFPNKKYDRGTDCGSGFANTECIERITLRNNIKITNVDSEITGIPAGKTKMHVTFLRPNQDAKIFFTNDAGVFVGKAPVTPLTPGYLTGKVTLTSPKGKTLIVTIESTGQVLVGGIN